MSDLQSHNPSSKELPDQDLKRAEQYWRQLLSGFTTPTVLGVDQAPTARVGHQRSSYDVEELTLSEAATSAMFRWVRQQHLTVNTVVHGALAVLLSRYSGSEDIVFGTTVSERTARLPGIESMAELFINTLPARVHVPPSHSVVPWLTELQAQQVTMREYEHTPLDEIQKWGEVPAGGPLFNTLLVVENIPLESGRNLMTETNGPNVQQVTGRQGGETDYPLTVVVVLGRTMQVRFIYDIEHYTAEVITRMVGHFQQVLKGIIGGGEQALLGAIPLLTEAEHQLMLVEWNDTSTNSSRSQCIHQLFEAQAERSPDAIAVVFKDEQMTYRDLNRRANQLAYHLLTLGVGPEVLVGICIERSLEMVVGLLGILKAGGAYVPLDTAYPQERLAFMLADSQAQILLTQQRLVEGLPEHKAKVVCLDTGLEAIDRESETNLASWAKPDNLAYVIYTSGSTGRPKGVLITHKAIVNHNLAVARLYGLGSKDRVLQFTSISFDLAAEEIFPSLLSGATVVLRPDQVLVSFAELLQFMEREKLTVLNPPTAYWHEWVSELSRSKEQLPPTVRLVIPGGEKASKEKLATWQKLVGNHVRWINGYGPTEATITATNYEPTSPHEDQRGLSVPIGRPIANTQIYILDRYLQPVAIGVSGELHIGGAGLARGYLNRPKLTGEKFISNPFSDEPSARLYKTGDLVRYLPDGNIEFMGRIDHQVKIRGFRIELGEIETILNQHPAIQEAVILDREDNSGNKRLVAYVIFCEESVVSVNELRDFLKEKLPSYMVPPTYMMLDTFPLTPNGKVDRCKLPAPDLSRPDLENPFIAPRIRNEEILAAIWGQLLGLEEVGVYDNFFELGGHSLLITQFISRVREIMQVELPLHSVFENPTVANQAELIERRRHLVSSQQFPPIRPIPRDGPLPLSFSQERVWFIQQLNPVNMAYNFQEALRFRGRLDVEALERSLSEIVQRHEIFRTTFKAIDGQPAQFIHPAQPVHLPIVDLQVLPESERKVEAQRLIFEEIRKPFNLNQLPLIRWTLLRLNEQEHILIHIEHHIVHDGWSLNIFLRELLEIYQAFSNGKPSPLFELPIQFVDFAHWQRQWMQGEVEETQLTYWQEKLAGNLPILQLPLDRPRPVVQSYQGTVQKSKLSLSLCKELRDLSRHEGLTLFVTMLSAFAELMHRYSGQDEICVGSGIANRRWHETEGLIGMIINNVVLRIELSGNPTFRELLSQVRQVTLEAYAHQDVPFDKVVKALKQKRDPSHNPLFQVMFSFHDSPLLDLEFSDFTVDLHEGLNSGSAKFDLNVIVIPRAEQRVGLSTKARSDGITIIWEYNTDLFDETTITRMVGHYQNLLEGMVSNPDASMLQLPILTEAERHQLLVEWDDTGTDYPKNSTIYQLFEAQAEKTPDTVAVVHKTQYLTYRELNRRANQLAHYLLDLGVGPDVFVGICMERSIEMVVGLLGILKAGGAYVPLDPEYPKERLTFMLADTQTPVLLTQQKLLNGLPETAARVLCLDSHWDANGKESHENPISEAVAENLAYVMYTSGSTGRPKGVCVTHRNVVRLVKATNYARLGAEEVFLQFAPISFDASTLELWGPLLNGGRLVVFPATMPSLAQLGEVIEQHQVTTLWLTAGLFHQMVEDHLDSLGSVRQLLAGGDVLSVPHVKQVLEQLDGCRLINGYGPTENTTFTTCYPVTEVSSLGSSVPIGRPIANTQVYILDAKLQSVPIGVSGELYTGGDGLARGYLNRPELTAEKFIPDPFSKDPAARLYKTGDLARYRPDGNIEFLGRIDHQVKIRGFRIEIGEVESVLGRHPAVEEAVVIVREDVPGDKRLVAYVVAARKQGIESGELRDFLQEKLPTYMQPSAFVSLDQFALDPNGKVDRQALPAPDQLRPELESVYVAPQSTVERIIAGVWHQVIRMEQVGLHDNFFELGGHSLLATQIISRLRDIFQVEVQLHQFFEKPTIAGLCASIEKAKKSGVKLQTPAITRISRKSRTRLTE